MQKQIFGDPIVILDTETDGLYNDAQILELAAVCLDEWGRVRSRFSSLVRPKKPVHPSCKALTVNNISLSDLAEAPDWETVQLYFDSWLRSIPCRNGEVISTAFNNTFDKRMLENHGFSLQWGMCIRSMTNKCMKAQNKQPKNAKGNNKAPSLEEACNYFQIPYPHNAHRALVDAEVTAKVAISAFQKIQELGLL